MKQIFTLISFFLVQPGLAQDFNLYYNSDLDLSLFSICIEDCGVMNQPRNPLYNYHDGGFSHDKSKAFMRFDDEETIDQMMKNVENNIKIRLNDLESKYQDLNKEIDKNLEDILDRDLDILEAVKNDNQLYDEAFRENLSSFNLPSDLLDEIMLLNTSFFSDQLSKWDLDFSNTHSIEPYYIEPDGFEFTGFEFREDMYGEIESKTHKLAFKEWHKSQKEYDDILVRFKQFNSRGESDPVFEDIEELLYNQHIAKVAVQNSLWISEEFDRIQAEYPDIDEDIIRKWVNAGKTKRYEALGYLPQSDKTFRYTTLDMQKVRTEITNVIKNIEDDFVIPQYACNYYTALLSNKIYNVNLDLFRDENGNFLKSNRLSLKAATDYRFKKIGLASEQTSLDRAAYLATIGKPVIALWHNPTGGDGHITLLLPGMTDFKSGTWERYVPWVTNYQKTDENTCKNCFTEGSLSNAFGSDKMNSTILYQLEN